MSDYIKKIRTKDGDKQIDYGSLANLPSFKTINGESILGSGDIKVETERDENQKGFSRPIMLGLISLICETLFIVTSYLLFN